jgi:hypothetical protein
MQFRFRLQTMLAAVAMAAVAMTSIRMSVPEDKTYKGLVPLLCFALIGICAEMLRGRNTIAGGAVGGVVGAFSNVLTQYLYYNSLRPDPWANVIYLGPATCLLIDSLAGAIIGVLLGSVVWLGLRLRAKVKTS